MIMMPIIQEKITRHMNNGKKSHFKIKKESTDTEMIQVLELSEKKF